MDLSFSSFVGAVRRTAFAIFAFAAIAGLLSAQDARQTFDLPADAAGRTLREFSIQAGQQVLYSTHVVSDVRTNAVRGSYTPKEAMDLLLEGTRLVAVQDAKTRAWRVRRTDETGASGSQRAQATETIHGLISNAATGAYLEGATVEIAALNLKVLTDSRGAYGFSHVPPGEHRLAISYTGLDSQTIVVAVRRGEAVLRNIELSSEVYQLEAVSVSSEREGNAAAITRQRNADNVMNVVATDAYGNVADGNLGNFMQRLPGVSILIENGDVIGFGVRGTPSEMNSVNIDGVRASSATAGSSPQGDRAVIIDSIPAEFIKEIELVKALTPDKPADSVGGTANLITKSALDLKGSLLSFRTGLNVNTYRRDEREPTPTGAFTYLTKLGAEEKIGIALSGSYTETTSTRDRVQMTRNQVDGRNTQARTLNDMATRIRSGLGLKMNYRPTPFTDLYASIQYTYFSFQQARTDWNITARNVNVASYSSVSRAQIEAGTAPRTATNTAAGVAPGYTDDYTELLHANFVNTTGATARHSRNYKFDFGGRHQLPNDQRLTFQASYNPSVYDFEFQFLEMRRATGGIGIAIAATESRERPRFVQTYGPSITHGGSLAGYTALRALNDEHGEEEVSHLSVDYEKAFSSNPYKLQFKSGLSWRRQARDLDVYQPRWDYVGADGVGGNAEDNLVQFRKDSPGYGIFNGQYPLRDQFDYGLFKKVFDQKPELFREQGTTVSGGSTYNEITEDVYAAYAMGRMRFGPLGVLGGVRLENTQVSASGRLTDPLNPSTERITRESDRTTAFPSVHFRYEPKPNLLMRASFSTGASRPGFNQLYPRTVVTYDTSSGLGQVRQNDPALKPQYTENYDLSIEYYFEPVGVVSAGWFYKDVNDFISAETRIIPTGADNGFGGLYEGFDLVTNRNFGSATIEGYELNYRQQLRMIPRALGRFSVFVNYTKIKTDGDYGNGNDELVRFIPETANAGLSWDYNRLNLRASYNYKSGYLNTYNANRHARQRVTDVETWDFTGQFKLSPRLTLFLDVVNAFNKWASWYSGDDPGRIIMSEVYGTRVSLGISGRF